MQSMTGYGSSQRKDRRLEVEIHVKAVNGRFFEARFHLPKEYAPFENDLRQIFSEWARGTIDVYVHRRPVVAAGTPAVTLRVDVARHWARQLQSLARELKLQNDVSLSTLLQLPQVLEARDRPTLFPGEMAMVHAQLRLAAAACQKARAREGQGLKRELLVQLKALDQLAKGIEARRPEIVRAIGQRLKIRLENLAGESLDPARLAVESALVADKGDVREEIVRLREHIKVCRELIQSGQARGKKLDFYCQELLREVNTIGSKSQMAALTEMVVEAKSVVEKFREQVQNIE